MHLGWSVEGAIGSQWKIDPSYLSPAVNVAHKVTMASPYYDVPVLVTEDLYNCCSEEFQNLMKVIDVVNVKGCDGPIKIFTFDVEESEMVEETDIYYGIQPVGTEPDDRIEYEEKMDQKKQEQKEFKKDMKMRIAGKIDTPFEMLSKDGEVAMLRIHSERRKTREFNATFHQAFLAYKSGDWQTAVEKLNQCKAMFPNDGPTISLYKYIASMNCHPPPNWEGVRDLEFDRY